MKRGSALLLGAIGWALHLTLATGALRGLPAPVALALAFAVTVLLPGYAFVAMGAVPPGGLLLAPTWAMGFGVAWNALLVVLTRALGVPFTVLVPAGLLTNALLWALAVARARGNGRVRTLGGARMALLAVVLAAGLAVVHVAQLGTPLSFHSDSPDHIGTIRRMLERGDAFPRDAFFKDAGEAGIDPRKGLWHPQVALIARLAGVDPVETWRWLSLAIAPLFILNAAAFGWLAAGAAGAATTAWAELLVRAGQLGWSPLRKAVFSTFLAEQLCLAAIIALLLDLEARRRVSRLAVMALALAAVATHVFSTLQLALTIGALGLGIALRDRKWSAVLDRLARTAVAAGLACLPYLLWRAGHAYAPVNPIHTEPQGLLWITGGVRIVSIGVLWDWMARLWVLFPLAWWALWRHGRHREAVLYILTTSVAIALLIFDPPVVALLEPRLGYLLMRFIWMAPITLLLGLAAVAIPLRMLEGGRARATAFLAALLVLILAWPTVRDGALTVLRPRGFAAAEAAVSPLRWRRDLAWMDRNLPPGRVVLSDPATSYAVPMLTRHYVVTLVDQHSSPNDSLALRRILDARDALDPYGPWSRTREVVRRYGVDVVVLNRRFTGVPRFDYWAPSAAWFDAARARLDRHPEAFERVYDAGDFAVYRVDAAALDTLESPPPPRPFVEPYASGRFPAARRLGDRLPAIHRLVLWPRALAPGDTLHGVAEWRALDPLPAGSYQVPVRFDRALPGGLVPPDFAAKPLRKLLEIARHERYRFRADHLPTGGAYGVDLWRPDEVVRDSFALEIPRDVADGTYAVEIKMFRQPHYPNYRASDYFLDRDYYSGVRMGSIRVVRRPPAGGAGNGARSDTASARSD